jgi:hypothetical protein
MNIATTIYEQLGGRRFRAMTGAKNFLDGGNYLQFDLPSRFAKHGINKVRVTLSPADTYTITFWRRRGLDLKEVAKVYDVYADNLREVFTRHTGLDCTL